MRPKALRQIQVGIFREAFPKKRSHHQEGPPPDTCPPNLPNQYDRKEPPGVNEVHRTDCI